MKLKSGKAKETQQQPQHIPDAQPAQEVRDAQDKNSSPSLPAKEESLDAKKDDLTDTLKRLQAEFENFKKWTEKENRERMRFANAQLITKFLPLLDTLDAALRNAQQDDSNPFARGLRMVHTQLLSLLRQEGLTPIECTGKQFDPHLHEVMLKEPSDKEEGAILEEFQKGYLLHDKVLRHSKVKISGQ